MALMCGNYTLLALAGESKGNNRTLSFDDVHDYEEPYFEPANKEEELVAQIKKLGVTEISRESKNLRSEYLNSYCLFRYRCSYYLC